MERINLYLEEKNKIGIEELDYVLLNNLWNSFSPYEKSVATFGLEDVHKWVGEEESFDLHCISFDEVNSFFGPEVNAGSLAASQMVSAEPVVRDDY